MESPIGTKPIGKRSSGKMIRSAVCPGCKGQVSLQGRLLIGEVFSCDSCGAQVEVAATDPVELEPFAKVEEDEEDFD